MEVKIDLCSAYTTTGWPDFRPKCTVKLRWPGLRCHKYTCQCPYYKPSELSDYWKAKLER